MFWADKVAQEIINSKKFTPYWVDDMKTPSGFSHVGSLMGPVIHSMIFRSLKDKGQDTTFTFVINDFDPADDLLPEVKGKFEEELGKPLKMAKSPNSKFNSMADLFGSDFVDSIKSLGVEAEILSSWKLYHEGKFDEVIKLALDNAEKIQDIYQKVSGSQKKEAGWLPFQVICENCGKIGTTKVYGWDGKQVSYKCEQNLVKWAKGCGFDGKISPFGGTGKLPWKVDWAAHWKVIGVTIEGAGKDHASKGGSYDIAMEICKEVFNYPQPFKLPYEFVLIGGKKMSSSKGIGLKASDLVKILPAQVARFLFARNGIKSQTNFDPNDQNAIPDLFDDYKNAADEYKKDKESDLARAFLLSQVGDVKFPPDIKFSTLIQYVQAPNKLSEIKKLDAEEWAQYANVWIERFAKEENRFIISETIPEGAQKLSKEQKEYLKKIVLEMDKKWEKEEFQKKLYDFAKELDIPSNKAFAAIYQSLFGKNYGPKAGYIILENKELVKKRFTEV